MSSLAVTNRVELRAYANVKGLWKGNDSLDRYYGTDSACSLHGLL